MVPRRYASNMKPGMFCDLRHDHCLDARAKNALYRINHEQCLGGRITQPRIPSSGPRVRRFPLPESFRLTSHATQKVRGNPPLFDEADFLSGTYSGRDSLFGAHSGLRGGGETRCYFGKSRTISRRARRGYSRINIGA